MIVKVARKHPHEEAVSESLSIGLGSSTGVSDNDEAGGHRDTTGGSDWGKDDEYSWEGKLTAACCRLVSDGKWYSVTGRRKHCFFKKSCAIAKSYPP